MRSDWLDAFLTFSESLNFTHAATRLHISQPALHVKIKKLSEFIGTPLYQKQGRELVLTETGRRIQIFARELHERSSAFITEIKTGQHDQPVVLAAGEGAFLYLLGPALSHFLKSAAHPLQLITADGQTTLQALLSGQAHMGITAMAAFPDQLQATRLTSIDQVVVMPRKHRLAKKKTIKLQDLENEPLILPPGGRPHRTTIERAFANQSLQLRIAVEAVGWEVMLHFVKLGIGISIVNSCCHIPATLVARSVPELPGLTYHILERKNTWKMDAVEQLKAILLEYKDHWRGK